MKIGKFLVRSLKNARQKSRKMAFSFSILVIFKIGLRMCLELENQRSQTKDNGYKGWGISRGYLWGVFAVLFSIARLRCFRHREAFPVFLADFLRKHWILFHFLFVIFFFVIFFSWFSTFFRFRPLLITPTNPRTPPQPLNVPSLFEVLLSPWFSKRIPKKFSYY